MRKNWLIVAAVAAAVLLSPCRAGAAEEAAKAAERRAAMKRTRRPAEFFSVFNFGYAGDNMPKEPERFEKLVKRISEEGRYNAILCKYTDNRAAICKQYGVKIMVDLLVAGHHVFKQPEKCEALCRKLRDNPVVLAYHLWSDRFGSRREGRRRDVRNVHEWDPTHPTYIGTYRADGMAFLAESDFISYYDFHWKRGPHKNFSHLLTAWRIAKANDGRIGRFVSTDPAFGKTGAGNIARHRYTLNTSIACGLKGCLWFVGSRTMNAKTLEWKGLGLDVNKVLAEIMPLKDEIPKLGNPVAIYSTPITRTLKNRPVPGKSVMPPGLQRHTFPGDFWIRPAGGEFVMGVFKYADGGDAVFVANHNAYAEQDVKLTLPGEVKASLFDRKEGEWRPLEKADGVVGFKLAAGGGELLRLDGRANEENEEKKEKKKDAAPAK
jgi:hypothetical protein